VKGSKYIASNSASVCVRSFLFVIFFAAMVFGTRFGGTYQCHGIRRSEITSLIILSYRGMHLIGISSNRGVHNVSCVI
jgi:hypothetical protein